MTEPWWPYHGQAVGNIGDVFAVVLKRRDNSSDISTQEGPSHEWVNGVTHYIKLPPQPDPFHDWFNQKFGKRSGEAHAFGQPLFTISEIKSAFDAGKSAFEARQKSK